MTNSRIADIFDEIADLLEFQGSNPFRVRAYRNGARIIRDLPEPLTAVLADASRKLTDLEGIGKDLAEKIQTLVETGELRQYQELLEQVPATVLDMMRVPGLGPKKAAALYKELNIATLDQLKAACEAQQVRQLKGFGAKTEQTILHGISIAAAANERVYWAEADEVAQDIRTHLSSCPSITQLELAGSYRRGKETVGDLDILVVSQDAAEVMNRLAEYPDLSDVIGRGDTKMSIRTHKGLQVDVRVVPAESFGAALQYFTGSKDHNVVVRGLAKQRGLKINEYGVYRIDGDEEVYVAGATEEEVYATLDLPYFPPELRESRREFEWAAAGELPELITVDDIRGDLHMHTTATDGRATLEEMVAAARARGLSYIAITDHSQRVSMARGLDAKRVLAQWKEIDALNKTLDGKFIVLKGIECDILEAGGMDLPDDVLAQADFVLASIHYGQQQSRDQITQRILGAIENPTVTAIAHPTGRILNRREAYEVDIDAVFSAAAKHGKLLELNANPARLDLHDVHCAAAKAHGIPIVINTDAHSIDGLDCMRYGILQARRAGLTKQDVANTRTWPQLQKLITQEK
jgi:DNA polymerase (family 10)